MKKFTLLMTACLMGLSATLDAQVKKTWDFSQGLSEADRTNLIADATNWNTNGEGDAAYWNDKTKLSGTIKANGEPLEFLQHLIIGTNGLSKNNNFKLGPKAYRMNRVGMRTYLPKLANGQKITVMARSANGKATDRGLIGNANMTYVSGPANGICPGNQVEGSEGTYTLVWEVKAEGADSVDCCIEIVGGGVDIQSIVIDNGDEEKMPDTYKVAYLYDGTYNGGKDKEGNYFGYQSNGGLEADPIYATLNDNFTVDTLNLSTLTMTSAELNDSLIKYDAVVLSGTIGDCWNYVPAMVEIINKVPMVNFSSDLYTWGKWTLSGACISPEPCAASITFNEDLIEGDLIQSLLKDIELESAEMQIFKSDEVAGGSLVLGYTALTGSLFEADEVLATVSEYNAIHTHGGKRNMYMLLPFSFDNLNLDGDWNITDDALTLVVNAVRTVADTKAKVTPAAAPAIAQNYKNSETRVVLSCATKGATIYYTLDDSDPTAASAVYSDTLVITTDGTVVKAIAVAQGYDVSIVSKATVTVKGQAAAPEINVEMADGKTVVTLTGAEGVNIYYSFNGIKTAAGSAVYDDQVGIELTEPATITYFAANDKLLTSDIQTYDITVAGIPTVKDTVAHFTANETDWFTNAIILDYQKETLETPTANWAAKAAYYFGKNAWSYYSTTEYDSIVTVKDAEGNVLKCIDGETDSTKTYYKPEPTAVKYVASATDKQWVLRTQGQLLTGETNVAPLYTVGAGEANYYAQSAYDLIGEPSKGKLTFGGKGSNEPYSAGVESTEKFQAPFDVVTYTTNGGGSPFVIALQTSADGENWTSVDTLSCASAQRYYVKDRMHVDGTDQLYVRLLQVGGSTKAQLYDIYVITTDGVSGIEAIKDNANLNPNLNPNLNCIFDLQGRRVSTMVGGRLYIQNGKKVIVK